MSIWRRYIFFLALLGLVLMAPAAQAVPGLPDSIQVLTVSSTAVGLTCTTRAEVQVKTNGIFFTFHLGTFTPTSSHYEGSVGDWIMVEYPSRFRAIRSGSSDATLMVTCFK